MSLKKFQQNDIFYNVVKTKPRFELKIVNGSTYMTSQYPILFDLLMQGGCPNPYSFDFSCPDNSQYIPLI